MLGTAVLIALSVLTAPFEEVKGQEIETKYQNLPLEIYLMKHYEKLEVGEKIEIITKTEKVVYRKNIQGVLLGEIESIEELNKRF